MGECQDGSHQRSSFPEPSVETSDGSGVSSADHGGGGVRGESCFQGCESILKLKKSEEQEVCVSIGCMSRRGL